MQLSLKRKIIGFTILLLAVSLACNAPFGLDLERGTPPPEEVVQIPTNTSTPTVTSTSTNTPTPTETPFPTPTSTRVVPLTSTPTPFIGDPNDPALGGQTAGQTQGGDTPSQSGDSAQNGSNGQVSAPAMPVAGPQNVIVNGSFEDPNWPEWIGIAPGWQTFDNGNGHVGFYDDTWEKVVYDGKHAQLIEIIADQGQGDRYAGIFQTVDVVPGATYELVMHGLVRSDEGSGEASNYGYVLQYGIDYAGGADWNVVNNWVDMPFPEHPREDPNASNVYNYGEIKTLIKPTGSKLTLYIRAWKKFAHETLEGNYDVDGISLHGVQPVLPETGDLDSASSVPIATIVLAVFSVLALSGGAFIGLRKRRSGLLRG